VIGTVAVAVTLAILPACETVRYFDTGEIVRDDGTNIIYVSEDYETFDASPGDTVIVIMSPANYPDTKVECADMGGRFSTVNEIDYCVNVDF
jgi:hypothetical protein